MGARVSYSNNLTSYGKSDDFLYIRKIERPPNIRHPHTNKTTPNKSFWIGQGYVIYLVLKVKVYILYDIEVWEGFFNLVTSLAGQINLFFIFFKTMEVDITSELDCFKFEHEKRVGYAGTSTAEHLLLHWFDTLA